MTAMGRSQPGLFERPRFRLPGDRQSASAATCTIDSPNFPSMVAVMVSAARIVARRMSANRRCPWLANTYTVTNAAFGSARGAPMSTAVAPTPSTPSPWLANARRPASASSSARRRPGLVIVREATRSSGPASTWCRTGRGACASNSLCDAPTYNGNRAPTRDAMHESRWGIDTATVSASNPSRTTSLTVSPSSRASTSMTGRASSTRSRSGSRVPAMRPSAGPST